MDVLLAAPAEEEEVKCECMKGHSWPECTWVSPSGISSVHFCLLSNELGVVLTSWTLVLKISWQISIQ